MSDGNSKGVSLGWEERSRETVYQGSIFNVVESEQESSDGRRGRFLMIDSPDWVHVIGTARDAAGVLCFIMVRQHRHAGECVTLEFPGGLLDSHESPEEAGARELEEETGYRPERVYSIGRTNPNPAIMTNTVHSLFAEGCRRVAEQNLDQNEIVDLELIPVEEILRGKRAEFSAHAIMLAGLYWYTRWQDESAADG